MSQQKSFSKKMYLPFKQKCLHRWRGRKTSSSQLEQEAEWQRLQFHSKSSALCGMQGEREEQYQKGHGRILQDTTPLAGTLYFCNQEAKITLLLPERLFVHTRFLSKVLLYGQLLV